MAQARWIKALQIPGGRRASRNTQNIDGWITLPFGTTRACLWFVGIYRLYQRNIRTFGSALEDIADFWHESPVGGK
jgi:hypothetical protein